MFKRIIEGTLEEKISAVIDFKKNLFNKMIAEDNPGVRKTVTRDELPGFIKNRK